MAPTSTTRRQHKLRFAALAIALTIGWSIADAQEKPSSPTAPVPATLTAKERLTSKAADDQRIEDCNVPPQKRTKPRPAARPWDLAQPGN